MRAPCQTAERPKPQVTKDAAAGGLPSNSITLGVFARTSVSLHRRDVEQAGSRQAVGEKNSGGPRARQGRFDVVVGNEMGFPVVGVASTIDNDLYGSEIAIGVDTALNIALEAIDRLKITASSHHRAFLVEVMGRHCGYLPHGGHRRWRGSRLDPGVGDGTGRPRRRDPPGLRARKGSRHHRRCGGLFQQRGTPGQLFRGAPRPTGLRSPGHDSGSCSAGRCSGHLRPTAGDPARSRRDRPIGACRAWSSHGSRSRRSDGDTVARSHVAEEVSRIAFSSSPASSPAKPKVCRRDPAARALDIRQELLLLPQRRLMTRGGRVYRAGRNRGLRTVKRQGSC